MMRSLILLSLVVFLPTWLQAETTEHKNKGFVGVSARIDFNFSTVHSLASFSKHADQIDRIYFELYKLNDSGMPERIPGATPELQKEAQSIAVKNNVEQWMVVDDEDEPVTTRGHAWADKFLDDDKVKTAQIQALVGFAVKDGMKGIQVEIMNLFWSDRLVYIQYLKDLASACKSHGLLLGVMVAPKSTTLGGWGYSSAYVYPEIGKIVDEFIPRTDYRHDDETSAGEIVAPVDSEVVAKYSASVMDKEKIKVVCPTYGYDWVSSFGRPIRYEVFMELAKTHNVTPVRDAAYSQNLSMVYKSEKGQEHEAWIPDSATLEYQCDIVKRNQLNGIAIFDLGFEDENLWNVLKKVNSTPSVTAPPLPTDEQTLKMTTYPLKSIELFSDWEAPTFSEIDPVPVAKDAVSAKYWMHFENRKRWIDVHFLGTINSSFELGCGHKDLRPYLENGALRFYIRGTEINEMRVGFQMEKGLGKDEKYEVWTDLPLSDYATEVKDWYLVVIPLKDFSSNGSFTDLRGGSMFYQTFKWGQVEVVYFAHSGSSGLERNYQISTIWVTPSYEPKKLLRK